MKALLLTATLAASLSLVPQDPARDLKARDPLVRLGAVAAIEKQADDKSEKLLLGALKDKDWEVRERAAQALGRLGGDKSIKPLVKMALEAPARRLRRAAALAAGTVDQQAAAAAFLKKASGKTAGAASEAFATALRDSDGSLGLKSFEKILRGKDSAAREFAARALVTGSHAMERQIRLKELLAHDDLVVRAAVLDQIAERAVDGDLGALTALLTEPDLDSVIERRLLRASRAVLFAADKDQRKERCTVLLGSMTKGANVLARRVRLIEELKLRGEGMLDDDALLDALDPAFISSDVAPRAAAAKALRTIGGEKALAAAGKRFDKEDAGRARYQLLETILALTPVQDAEHAAWLAERLASDADAAVRERAAVALGVKGLEGAGDALAKALSDAEWGVVVCAAVSLGKTRETTALPALVTLAGDDDWKKRGAAVVGLGWANRRGAVEPLIRALGDPEPAVARAALESLRYISSRLDVEQTSDAWTAWWSEHEDKHRFVDKAELEERRKRFGYDVPDAEVYKGLDVIVFQSRGDHIEKLLERLEIEHRTTEANKLHEAALHPGGVYVANCTGEIEGSDVEPIAWFVRTGGSLFASCWALTHTVGRIAPGILRKADTPGEVLDDVRAYACSDSSFLTGVFPEGVVPIYHLEGAHLIEVLDYERAEVLIDSPDAAERHGAGDLAAWFRFGHGVVLDSVNHFDLQGLELVTGLKKPEQVQAYAVDHMGLDYAKLREIAGEKFWKSANSASKHVPDLSAFRFVTNFVRAKRIGIE
ncbi:MAG: HEAT repeat domain-containing protein [bacterium]|nr:HEAT repeat domain-containing protein [bacterium]